MDDFEYFKGEWLESGQGPGLSPTAFLVEQGPRSVLPTHFHRENEYQVVVQGGGKFGAHPVHAVTVHYAGAYTGYGPIVAGDDGLMYFTIRAVFEQGAVFLPSGREQMVRGPKRQLHSKSFFPKRAEELAALSQTSVRELFEPQADGIAATVIALPPDGQALAPPPSGGAGQFLMVLAGSLLQDTHRLTEWEMIFVSPEEPAHTLRAGPAGAEVLSLKLACKAREYLTSLDITQQESPS
ncbi:MAG TPA: hypothetical protein VEA41_00265 [Salinarimonas sp.]|nr:hypothetical protein [Salinarimonas sp.]